MVEERKIIRISDEVYDAVVCNFFRWGQPHPKKTREDLNQATASSLLALAVLGLTFIALSTQSSLAQRTSTPVPPFKLAHEDYRNPVSLVVADNATDQQIISLLWKIRNAIGSRSFSSMGLQPEDAKNRYNTQGIIETLRARSCASE